MANNTLNNSRNLSNDKSFNNLNSERPNTSKLNNSNNSNLVQNNISTNNNNKNSIKGFSFKEEKTTQGTNSAVPLKTDQVQKKNNEKKNKLELNVQKERFEEILREEKDKQNRKRLEEFEKNLNNKLCDLLVDERKKEQERENLLQQCSDPNEKKRLTKILAMEKAEANEKIVSFNK
jgi:hypothetical protein